MNWHSLINSAEQGALNLCKDSVGQGWGDGVYHGDGQGDQHYDAMSNGSHPSWIFEIADGATRYRGTEGDGYGDGEGDGGSVTM